MSTMFVRVSTPEGQTSITVEDLAPRWHNRMSGPKTADWTT